MSTIILISSLVYTSTTTGSTIFYQSSLKYTSSVAYSSSISGGSTVITSSVSTTSSLVYQSSIYFYYSYNSTLGYVSTLIYYDPSFFPIKNSVPPSNFFTYQGLPGWLNQNPSYKQYFVNSPRHFPYLLKTSTVTEYISTVDLLPELDIYRGYKVENVPIAPFITMNDQNDSRMFREHLRLFRQVYEHNSNAWVNYVENEVNPVYYRFPSSSERTKYLTARGTIYKLYPFDAISSAKNEAGSTLGWIFPFPF